MVGHSRWHTCELAVIRTTFDMSDGWTKPIPRVRLYTPVELLSSACLPASQPNDLFVRPTTTSFGTTDESYYGYTAGVGGQSSSCLLLLLVIRSSHRYFMLLDCDAVAQFLRWFRSIGQWERGSGTTISELWRQFKLKFKFTMRIYISIYRLGHW